MTGATGVQILYEKIPFRNSLMEKDPGLPEFREQVNRVFRDIDLDGKRQDLYFGTGFMNKGMIVRETTIARAEKRKKGGGLAATTRIMSD